MDIMPKRRKYKDNPYVLSKDEEKNLYLVSFVDGTNTYKSIRISKKIYDEMDFFERLDIRQMNEYDRHSEHILLDENSLAERIKDKPIPIDDTIIYQSTLKELHLAINKLPIIQKQRIIDYYFNNLTEVEIAEKYSISQKNVSVSLFKAKENLKRILKKFN